MGSGIESFQLWRISGESCPEGTVPIRRTLEEDVLRASSIQRFGRKSRRPAVRAVRRDSTSSGHEVLFPLSPICWVYVLYSYLTRASASRPQHYWSRRKISVSEQWLDEQSWNALLFCSLNNHPNTDNSFQKKKANLLYRLQKQCFNFHQNTHLSF